MDSLEPLLQPEVGRHGLYPLRFPDIYQFYTRARDNFWTEAEIAFGKDLQDWMGKLNDDERQFIIRILAFFAQADFIVSDNLVEQVLSAVQVREVRMFYDFQVAMEDIHIATYATMLETYVTSPREREEVQRVAASVEPMQAKNRWCTGFITAYRSAPTGAERDRAFVDLLIAFAVVEGVFFCSSFCGIVWLNARGMMYALTQSNELIRRDEALHRDFAIHLCTRHVSQLNMASVERIIREGVALELGFVKYVLNTDLQGMNATSMSEYVRHVANHLFSSFFPGAVLFPDTRNPFEWMELSALDGKTDFFVRGVTEYQRSNLEHTGTHDDLFSESF